MQAGLPGMCAPSNYGFSGESCELLKWMILQVLLAMVHVLSLGNALSSQSLGSPLSQMNLVCSCGRFAENGDCSSATAVL